jgi:hypothetical protein
LRCGFSRTARSERDHILAPQNVFTVRQVKNQHLVERRNGREAKLSSVLIAGNRAARICRSIMRRSRSMSSSAHAARRMRGGALSLAAHTHMSPTMPVTPKLNPAPADVTEGSAKALASRSAPLRHIEMPTT